MKLREEITREMLEAAAIELWQLPKEPQHPHYEWDQISAEHKDWYLRMGERVLRAALQARAKQGDA